MLLTSRLRDNGGGDGLGGAMMGRSTPDGRNGGRLLARDRARIVGVATAALLLAVAVMACGTHPAPDASPTYTLGASSTPGSPGPSAGESDPASPDSSGDASLSPDPSTPPIPDPVASELDQINQLINDLNNSISGSSQQGGE
jgi:hypothetical protein